MLERLGRQEGGQGGPQPREDMGDVRGAGRVWPGRPWQGGSSEGQRRVLSEGRGRLFKAEERRGVKSGLGWRHQRNRGLRVILMGPGEIPWGPTALAWWPGRWGVEWKRWSSTLGWLGRVERGSGGRQPKGRSWSMFEVWGAVGMEGIDGEGPRRAREGF